MADFDAQRGFQRLDAALWRRVRWKVGFDIMAIRSYRQVSRTDWGNEESEGVTLEQINTGAILRIADAAEKMAQRHTELIRDRDYWERRAKDAERALDTERHRTASLRGHLKRAKKMMSNV